MLGHVLSIILWSDDPSELSSAVILLVQLLRTCPTNELLSSTSDSPTSVGDSTSAVFAHILAAAGQLLSPNQPDTCSTEAGQLLMQLLKTFPAQLAAPAPAGLSATGASSMAVLLEGVAVKLARGNCSPATLFPLLQFVVNLALLDVQQLVETLTRMSIQQKGKSHMEGSMRLTSVKHQHCLSSYLLRLYSGLPAIDLQLRYSTHTCPQLSGPSRVFAAGFVIVQLASAP